MFNSDPSSDNEQEPDYELKSIIPIDNTIAVIEIKNNNDSNNELTISIGSVGSVGSINTNDSTNTNDSINSNDSDNLDDSVGSLGSLDSSQSTNSDDLDKCKYCLQHSKETTSPFVNPCLCTNPICLGCLKKQIDFRKSTVCEICMAEFQITADMNITMPNSGDRADFVVQIDNYDDFFEDVSIDSDIEAYEYFGINGENFICGCFTVVAFVIIFVVIVSIYS